ncbi:hypothetical protein J1N35_008078 [Gossypium stocksii]|uniref:Uncharacterized protein n=1 Tax=Gossypium stocksii TaxID=47602 RepID=A0A9D3WAD1_9ROSI|nr:hypothetical protein J1N35_008078 [Gossypium stocksii]
MTLAPAIGHYGGRRSSVTESPSTVIEKLKSHWNSIFIEIDKPQSPTAVRYENDGTEPSCGGTEVDVEARWGSSDS